MTLPKSAKGKLKAIINWAKSDQSFTMATRTTRARDFEEHALRHYQRKYGKKAVRYQRASKHTRKRPDMWVP